MACPRNECGIEEVGSMNNSICRTASVRFLSFRLLPVVSFLVFLILVFSSSVQEKPEALACIVPRDEIATDKDLPLGCSMTLNTELFDVSGSCLSYEWYGPFSPACGSEPTVFFPEGTHAVSLFTFDGSLVSGPYILYVSVYPGFSISTCVGKGKAVITWRRLEGARRYRIYRSKESTPSQFEQIADLPAASTSFTNSNLGDATYFYTVGAYVNGHWLYSKVKSCHPYSLSQRRNYPPVIYSSPVMKGFVGLPYTYNVQAGDPQGDTLTYSLISPPKNMKIDSMSGLIEWIPPHQGDYEITVKVRDCNGLYCLQKYILEADDLPEVNLDPVADAGGPYSSEPGRAIVFSAAASYDPDGEPLRYNWNFGDGSTGTGIAPSHTYASPGTYQVSLSVSDGRCGTAEAGATAEVARCLPPSVDLAAEPAAILQGEPCTLVWISTDAKSLSIDNGVGPVGATGTTTVRPDVTTTYTITASGACSTASRSVTVIVHKPPTVKIDVDPGSIMAGQTARLSWSSTDADSLTIDQGIGSVVPIGSMPVAPSVTTTFTITATGPGGTASSSVRLNVNRPPQVTLKAEPSAIIEGGTAMLAWTSEHAEAASLDNGIGAVEVNGSLPVSPSATTEYTINVKGPGGNASAAAIVNVLHRPTANITASPDTINEGESSTLTWSSTNADSVVLDQGIGPVPADGSMQVTPAGTTTYSIIAAGAGGTAQEAVTVQVNKLHAPRMTCAYITNYGGQDLSVVDLSTNRVTARIPVGPGPFGTAVSPDGDRVYAACAGGDGGVYVIDADTNTVTGVLPEMYANTLAVSPDGSILYAVSTEDGTLTEIDARSLETLRVIDAGSPRVAKVSPDGRRIFIASQNEGLLRVVDASSLDIIDTIQLSDPGTTILDIEVSPDGKRIYAVIAESCWLYCIDAETGAVVNSAAYLPERRLSSAFLALSPDGGRLYLSFMKDEGQIFIIDPESLERTVMLDANNPSDIDFKPDGSFAYIPDYDLNGVEIIDDRAGTLSTPITEDFEMPYTFGCFIAGHKERISGRIVMDGSGVEGITVTLSGGLVPKTCVTDSLGRYFFYAAPGRYTLSFGDEGFLFSQQDLVVIVVDKEVLIPDTELILGVKFWCRPESIPSGRSSSLHWSSFKAADISIDQGIGAVGASGTRDVSPLENTAYTITAADSQGRRVAASVTVTVLSKPSVSLSVDPNPIAKGQQSTLTWSSTDADLLILDPYGWNLDKSGALTVSPSETTTYSLTATGPGGTATASVILTVHQPPQVSFTAGPGSIDYGQSSTLYWSVTGSTSVTIDHGVGSVDPAGSIIVSPAETSTYTLTATGPGGTTVSRARIDVLKCIVRGTARDASSGAGLPGVSVRIANDSKSLTAVTDANGLFSLVGAVCGNITATFEAPGYLKKTISGTVYPGTDCVLMTYLETPPPLALAMTSPQEGQVISLSPVTVTGTVSNDAEVLVNGLTATVGAGVFTASVPLADGSNVIGAVARDGYGQEAASQITVTYDPSPYVNISASPDHIEAGASAQLKWTSVNADTVSIDQGIGEVALNGSLTVSPISTTTYTMTASRAGKTAVSSATVTVHNPISLIIESPANGSAINRPNIMVKGILANESGNETNVSVNGVPAIVWRGQFVANHVPLVDGANTITVNATDSQGHKAVTAVTVGATTTGPSITLGPDDAAGVSPLTTTLRIASPFTGTPSLHAFGPGPVEFLDGSTAEAYISRMTTPGIYIFTADVTDLSNTYSDTVAVVVSDAADTDARIRSKWNGMKSRLIAGDIEGALDYFARPSQDQYRKIFTYLSDQISGIAANMEEIEQIYADDNVAKYRIMKDEVVNGGSYRITHYIYFVRDGYGHWYIDSF